MEQYKYKLVETNKFKKELSKVKQKYKNKAKKEYQFVIETLLKGQMLPPQYKNHLLEPKSKRVLRMPYKA